MSNSMLYQGYAARIEFSSEDECFIGHIAGIKDIIGFHGETASKLKTAFEDAVTGYLETCHCPRESTSKAFLMMAVVPYFFEQVAK